MLNIFLNGFMMSSQAKGILAGVDTGGIKIDQMSGRASSMLATLDGSHQVSKLLGEPGRLSRGTTLDDRRERL